MSALAANYAEIQTLMRRACDKAKRQASSVHLLAVSKKQPDNLIEEAYALGIRDFGENYVQELLGRCERLKHLSEARWHLIGPLQTNKVKQIIGRVHAFHALDSEKLLKEFGKRNTTGVPLPVFVQVNIDREPTKSGLTPEDVPAFLQKVRAEKSVKLMGLMAIPSPHETPEQMRPAFRALRDLAEGLELSMGMSDDFPVAIEEGATWVRVGTRLFGQRYA